MQNSRAKKEPNRTLRRKAAAFVPSLAVAAVVGLGLGMPAVALAEDAGSQAASQADAADQQADATQADATQADATQADTDAQQDAAVENKMNVYRLYNPDSDEHFYTADFHEVLVITQERGWQYEGIGFTASQTKGQPVYRLYNTETNLHLWTTDSNERRVLLNERENWNDEGIAWYGVGKLKMTRLYNPELDQHLYTRDQNEVSIITEQGWHVEADAGTWSIISPTDRLPIDGTWIDTDSWTRDGNKHLYWIAEDGNVAKNRYIDPATNPLDTNAGFRAYATDSAAVVRDGAYQVKDGYAVVADADGKVATNMRDGFVTTSQFSEESRTYYFEDDLARVGLFSVNGKEYFGQPDTGALLKGGSYDDPDAKMTYTADADGVIVKKEETKKPAAKKASAKKVTTGDYGEQISDLAVSVATGISMGDVLRNNSSNAPFTTIQDPRVTKWNSLVEATLGEFGGNQAYSSCAQAVAAVIGATVDPDMAGNLEGSDSVSVPSGGTLTVPEYCAEHPEMYQPVTSAEDIQPGDILCRPEHIAIYVGNDAVRKRFPDSTATVFQASFPDIYPDLTDGPKDWIFGSYSEIYHVVGKNAHPKYPYIDLSPYL